MVRTLGQLAEHLGAHVYGDADCKISGVATLQNARSGDISFLANPRYTKYLSATAASAVILTDEYRSACPTNALVVADPYLSYAQVATLLSPPLAARQGRHPSAAVDPGSFIDSSAWIGPHCVIEEGAEIDAQVMVGPGCVIGRNCRIGAGSRLVANVTICQGSRIGKRALLHPGVVIGSDGFGLANDGGSWVKVPQLGGVTIGANTTVDRGALDDTVIEDGVKLDNQIQVAHNVYIGAHTAIAGCTGIAGSARIGARCTIGGGVGIVGHTEIADDVHITGMSFVAHSIRQPGIYSSGTPLEPNRDWRRNYARFHHLDDMARRLRHLEDAIKDIAGEETRPKQSLMKD